MTMTLIETKTLGTAASSLSFTSIPQDGTDLLILASVRGASIATNDALLMSINGDNSQTNGSSRWLQGTGSATASSTGSFAVGGITTGDSATSNTFGNASIYITNYAGTGAKSISSDFVTENNATQAFQRIVAGLSNATAAITSVSFDLAGPNLLAGSTISLYKITKGTDGIVVVS